MTTQEEWTDRSIDLVVMRVDFGYVIEAVDRYLEANPPNAPRVVSVHEGKKPLPRRSIASAVAAAAQLADGQLHEIGFRIVNALEAYEERVGHPRVYEHTMLLTHRNVYEATSEKLLRDGIAELKATRPPKEPTDV